MSASRVDYIFAQALFGEKPNYAPYRPEGFEIDPSTQRISWTICALSATANGNPIQNSTFLRTEKDRGLLIKFIFSGNGRYRFVQKILEFYEEIVRNIFCTEAAANVLDIP